MIYQLIEKAGNTGIWTRDIKTGTNVNQVPTISLYDNKVQQARVSPPKRERAERRIAISDSQTLSLTDTISLALCQTSFPRLFFLVLALSLSFWCLPLTSSDSLGRYF